MKKVVEFLTANPVQYPANAEIASHKQGNKPWRDLPLLGKRKMCM